MSFTNQLIKSIKIIKEYPFSKVWGIELDKIYTLDDFLALSSFSSFGNCEKTVTNMAENFPEFFEIEYELEKPKILKRPDGSLITEPDNLDQIVIIIDYTHISIKSEKWKNSKMEQILLKEGKVFDKQDWKLAEKKAEMLSKQFKITNEIERLNAESDWVADWNNFNQIKCSFRYNHSCKEIKYYSCWQRQSEVLYTSEEILDKIQNKYSEDELKLYLGVIS